jgi:hypothetical protein
MGISRESPPDELAVGRDCVGEIDGDRVDARAATDGVACAVVLGRQPVVAGTALEPIASGPAVDEVTAPEAEEDVSPVAAGNRVGARCSTQAVVSARAGDTRCLRRTGEHERYEENGRYPHAATETIETPPELALQATTIPPVGRLSQAISEGDGISILVHVADQADAEEAVRQGADALVVRVGSALSANSAPLPLMHLGRPSEAGAAGADAVVVGPDPNAWDEARAAELEAVVRVRHADELERALEEIDPDMFLLGAEHSEEPLETLLNLLHDVPAGKLAIAELPEATADDVAELERAGIDGVVVAVADVASLVGSEPPEV